MAPVLYTLPPLTSFVSWGARGAKPPATKASRKASFGIMSWQAMRCLEATVLPNAWADHWKHPQDMKNYKRDGARYAFDPEMGSKAAAREACSRGHKGPSPPRPF